MTFTTVVKTNSKLLFLLLLIAISLLSCDSTFAINATGSEYVVTRSLSTLASSSGTGDIVNYSGGSAEVASAVTGDAQGLEYGAVIGITGNAVLTQDKDPIINSYSLTPNPVNQSSWVRVFVSAVYTTHISVNITRPDNTVDTIDMGSQSVYYYPYTNLIGRYDVTFLAEGNSVVTADDDFDVIEEEPYIPPEEEEEDNSGGNSGISSTVLDYNSLYISIMRTCKDVSGIIVEVANDTGIVPGAFVGIKSSVTGNMILNSTTDQQGLARFNLSSEKYIILTSALNHMTSSRNYELDCDITTLTGLTDNNSTIIPISGNAVQDNIETEDASLQDSADDLTVAELARAARILDRQSNVAFTIPFYAYLTFASLAFLFALIVLLKFYRDDNAVGVGIENRKIIPRFIVVNNTGIIEKKLMPIEKAIIKIEGEIQELVHEPVNKELHEDQKKKDLSRPIMFSSILKDAETKEPTSKSVVNTTEVQETLDMSYDKVAEKPRKYLKKEVISIQNLSPDIKINPYLSRVQEEHVFILRDGKRVCSIEELVKELKLMNDDVFKYHVTDYKNDFATWIYNTLGYKELAEAIGPIKSREKMIDMVQFGIDRLNS